MPGIRVVISGRVQGVGYRAWTSATARKIGLAGWVRNRHDGTVEALFIGEASRIESMIAACRKGPMLARVDDIFTEMVEEAAAEETFITRETV